MKQIPSAIVWLASFFMTIGLFTLVGCNSSDSIEEAIPDIVASSLSCETSDNENIDDDCGTLLLGLTDADGDFLTYRVEVTGLELTRNDGVQVSVVPTSQMLDFANYVELSELLTAATIPAGVYRSGRISLSYANADIQVEKAGGAVVAQLVDDSGVPLESVSLALSLDADNPLVIARHRPALLELDFNLAVSHSVDLEADPVTVTTEAFISAEVDPVMSKEFRVRGPLIGGNESDDAFRIAVRPFHRKTGRFGGVNLNVNEDTNYQIDGMAFIGEAGLAQLATLEQGTPTLSMGTFNRGAGRFTAISVLAGSSVPGFDKDAAQGVIVARNGDTLKLKGASIVRETGEVSFSDDLTVIVADTTQVSKPRRIDDEVDIAALSVGQAVTILGDLLADDTEITMDASEGAVMMRLTYGSGHQLTNDHLTLTMTLQALQGRAPDTYDFSGTGIDESFDADPAAYEVSVASMMTGGSHHGEPIGFSGFVRPFGSAPADFEALGMIHYAESRSQLVIDWPMGDDVVAFSNIDSQSFTINISNQTGGLYKLIQGGIRTDLSSFESAVVVEPDAGRGMYTLRSEDSVMAFSDFADFSTELQSNLEAGMTIGAMHAMGGFDSSTTTFNALKVAIKFD